MKKEYILVGLTIIAMSLLILYAFMTRNKSQKTKKQIEVAQITVTPTEAVVKEEAVKGESTIDKSKKYTAVLTTTVGDITIELAADKTPITVNNFVTLAKKNFYNNSIFHRVIKGFMIQGGDPEGTGRGGPGYQFDDEPFEGEYTRGTIAMANAGPNTNGSQFFIMHQDNALPKNYVIFGKVIEGLDVVDKIAESPVEPSDSGESSKPIDPVTVQLVQIVEE